MIDEIYFIEKTWSNGEVSKDYLFYVDFKKALERSVLLERTDTTKGKPSCEIIVLESSKLEENQ